MLRKIKPKWCQGAAANLEDCSKNLENVLMCAYHMSLYCESCVKIEKSCCPKITQAILVEVCSYCKDVYQKEEMVVFAEKYFCIFCLPDRGEKNFYIFGMGHKEISEVVNELAEKCGCCLGPKSYICT